MEKEVREQIQNGSEENSQQYPGEKMESVRQRSVKRIVDMLEEKYPHFREQYEDEQRRFPDMTWKQSANAV